MYFVRDVYRNFYIIVNESGEEKMIRLKKTLGNGRAINSEEANIVEDQNTNNIEEISDNEIIEIQSDKLKVTRPQSKSKPKASRSANGVCTIINSDKNGKRVTFSKEVMDQFKNPKSLEIGFTDNGLVVGEKLPENGVVFSIRKSGNKGVIYSSSLVQEITKLFKLDFSDRVSITFVEAEELAADYVVIEIKIK